MPIIIGMCVKSVRISGWEEAKWLRRNKTLKFVEINSKTEQELSKQKMQAIRRKKSDGGRETHGIHKRKEINRGQPLGWSRRGMQTVGPLPPTFGKSASLNKNSLTGNIGKN